MRVPTPSEALFLAGTAATAIALTTAIVPEVIEEYQEQVTEHADKPNPASDWNNGFTSGVAATTAIVATAIYRKASQP